MITPGKRLQVSGREAREIRLYGLLGYTGDATAWRMGRDRKTVNAAIHAGGLEGPEAPFEMAWLSLRREFDALAETMANGGEVERPQMLRLAAELRHTEAAMRRTTRKRKRKWMRRRTRMTLGSALKRLNSNDAWTPQDYALRALAKRGLHYLDAEMKALLKRNPFLFAALDTQVPPPGLWRTWLFMGGRGAGKTRAGAKWVRMAVKAGCRRAALVGPALSDVREVMIEGPSCLQHLEGAGGAPISEVSRGRLVWPNGAEGFAFSAEDQDSLRGP
ncbi:MAG: hypothetical protein ACI9NG_002627 [Hyphomonas sp.]|jgi:hypothetical protein